jgi:hypothetical protein
MKASILTLVSFVLLISNLNAQTIRLQDIIQDSKNEINADVNADSRGGTIVFNRTYNSNCIGSYHIKWSFSKDISTLADGDEFTVTLSCVSCNTPCGYKWKIATVTGANNITSIGGLQSYQYNGNITLISTTAESFGVHDWYPGHLSHTYTFKYSNKKDVQQTAFVFTFAEFHIYYVFQKGAVQNIKGINCHTLLGLGKLIAALEIGAYEGYGWDWMDRTIDMALTHIVAIKCLSPVYLKDLKSRIYQAQNTNDFYAEIQSYSQSLETEVASSCRPCSACKE